MNKSIKSLSIPQKSLKKLVGLPADNLYKEGFLINILLDMN